MTRRTLLSALTATIAGKDSIPAASMDLQEMPADPSTFYVLTIDGYVREDAIAPIQKAWEDMFAPEKAPKLFVADKGTRLSIAQPLGAEDIEASVGKAVTRALNSQLAAIQDIFEGRATLTDYERRRAELLPLGLCRKCEEEPAYDHWTRQCRKCNPDAAITRDHRDAAVAYEKASKAAKEREWLARHTV